ncbi:hypothetical protein DFW101_3582 [Solidesulfovibrio carbinoliphilus subsp. oakridgensis]|uniref:Lipoprotein n=1 Tax=Solidesulfovibrio carbinoliphilus subsp. oakridgensis TaxID=694327 RepID=G7Q5L9_9BACT|nr:hypothetical protein [Solidesulfovibrio carbinoliphilus]EHJ49578.1 hypothetical protein DFW101_3582 [Solidesulfovibrio carbinoliphilus subsp. oakridgensis]
MHRLLFPILALCVLACAATGDPALAASEQDPRKVTLYGMFHQTPEGGIVFNNAEEPDAVYLPFDPGSIMGEVVNIQVQVQGEIRDSFTRQGKNYRILAVSDIRPMTAEYGSTTIEQGQRFGLPGADAGQIHAYHDKTCYLYDRYAVLETLASYSDGHTLRVLAHAPGDSKDAVCENLEGRPLFEILNGGDFSFAGLSGDTLFVRNGPADAIHGLMAVNLATQKQTLDATVVPGSSLDKGTLRYSELLGPHAAQKFCPAGQTAIMPMALDLKTGTPRDAGKPVCRP